MAIRKPLARPDWWMALSEGAETHHYLGVRDRIAAHIHAGDLIANACLPSERQLQTGTGAARGTVRAALFQLEAEGLIYRRDRSGWYVSPPPVIYDPTHWDGFMTYVAAQGRTPKTELLDAHAIAATVHLAEIFGLEIGATLFELRRRRHIDDRAVLIETIYVDPRLTPDLLDHNLDGSLTQVLRHHYDISVARNRIEMQPCALTQDEAQALNIKSGLPGLLVRRISTDSQGRVVEYDLEYWRHDALTVRVEVGVGGG
jgi:DNA-binding GntR family transcriptional regulator